jgi:hypothetical protein
MTFKSAFLNSDYSKRIIDHYKSLDSIELFYMDSVDKNLKPNDILKRAAQSAIWEWYQTVENPKFTRMPQWIKERI